jgi:SAM-dependent methyltransferase
MTELEAILDRWRAGAASAEITLMELLIAAPDLDGVQAAVAAIPTLAGLLEANRAGCARIRAMLASGADPGPATAPSVDEGLESVRRLFDYSVAQDEAASVALYSLGNPEILARATAEIVALLAGWGVLAPAARALELGCGIGRLLGPLADRIDRVVGLDVSPRMVEAAARRTAGHPRVRVALSSGRDLAGFDDASFELVLAVDSFPYIVQAGPALAATMFGEIGRVLVRGGAFALMNYSYRGDDEADRADVAALAAASGLQVAVAGTAPFSLWNGLAFLLRR